MRGRLRRHRAPARRRAIDRLGELEERVRALAHERDALRRGRASARSASVGLVITGATHELRNPLSAALGNLEIAVEEVAGGTGAGATMSRADLLEVLGDALAGVQAVRALVADLGLLIERSAGPASVAEGVATAARLAGQPIRNTGPLQISVEDGLAVALSPPTLLWLLLDLFQIAVGARGSRGPVTLRAERDGAEVVLAVRGPGDAGGVPLGFVDAVAAEVGGRVAHDPIAREVRVWLPAAA